MRPQIVKILILILLLCNNISLLAQKVGPPAPGGNRNPPQASIDESILILIIVGLVFGAYITFRKHKLTNTAS